MSSDKDSDDDLLLDAPIFKKRSRSEKNKDDKMHNYLDVYLEKETKRCNQREIIRGMQNHSDQDSGVEKNSSEDTVSEEKIQNSNSSKNDANSKNKNKGKKGRKEKQKESVTVDKIDQKYKSIMEDNEKYNREKRKRKLQDAADGIDFDQQETDLFNANGYEPEILQYENNERRADIATAKVTGFSSKLGVRRVLHGYPLKRTDINIKSEFSSNMDQRMHEIEKQCSLEFYSSEEIAIEKLKQIISNNLKKKGKLNKILCNLLFVPIQRALKASVLAFFLQNGTLGKSLMKNSADIESAINENRTEAENFHYTLSEILEWLWNLSSSRGYPNPINSHLREGAAMSIIILMKQDLLFKEHSIKGNNINCNEKKTKSNRTRQRSSPRFQNEHRPLTKTKCSFLLFKNCLLGFQLVCGYKCPIQKSAHGDENNDTDYSRNLQENEMSAIHDSLDLVGLKNYLQIWEVAFHNNIMTWEDNDESVFRLGSECLEVLVFASLDDIFYSGNGLLGMLQTLISSMLYFMHRKFQNLSSQMKNNENETFYTWIKMTARQIIAKCQHLSSGAPKSTDFDDSNGWLALALLVSNILIFKNNSRVDLLAVLLKMEMSKLALYFCFHKKVSQQLLNNEENDEHDWEKKINVKMQTFETSCQNNLEIPTRKLDLREYCFNLAWKCMALAEIGISIEIPEKIQKDGPCFHATISTAHACAEIANSLMIFPNSEKSLKLLPYIPFLFSFAIEDKNKVPALKTVDQCEGQSKSSDTYESKFPSQYKQHLRVMQERLNILEEHCQQLKKNITMVFTQAHLRRVKELFVWLAVTYRQWKMDVAKMTGTEDVYEDSILVQSTLQRWVQNTKKSKVINDKFDI